MFGIDFGTTCSAVSGCVTAGSQMHITHYGEKSGRPVPSAVAVNSDDGRFVIGYEAWMRSAELGSLWTYIPSIKRLLGTDWTFSTPQGLLEPVDIAGLLFNKLQSLTRDRTGLSIQNAVVAIPIGFDTAKRRQLREAAGIAGIQISSFVSEPTAAFFANYDRLKNAHQIAVFDWGGGTLDVSILRHEDGAIFEEATVGLEKAGNDIDELLARRVHDILCSQRDAHIAFEEMEPHARDLLRTRCEEAKRAFSTCDTAPVHLNCYGSLGPCRTMLDYNMFSELISSLVEEAVQCLILAARDAGLDPGALDCVLMTGGSSNLRPIRNRLQQELTARLVFPDESVWNVSDGAAALATSPGIYRSNQKLGIRLSDNSYFGLLHEGDSLDGWRQSYTFGLVDGTEQARIVFTGSQDIDNDELRHITLPFPAYNFMQEMLRLDAEVDDDHVFRVTATSTMRPDRIRRVWEYTRLKRYYEIPAEVRHD